MNLRNDMRSGMTVEQQELEEWVYQYTKYPEGVILLGVMVGFAADHQDWTFWQVLTAARKKLPQ